MRVHGRVNPTDGQTIGDMVAGDMVALAEGSRCRAVGLVHELLLVASLAMPLTPEASAGERGWSRSA